jgi:hypothetical protein
MIASDVERKLRDLAEKIKGGLPTQMDGGDKRVVIEMGERRRDWG